MTYLLRLEQFIKDNKYSKWYKSIITAAIDRPRPDCYCEKHHIIPKSIDKSVKADKLNLVLLTAREHLVCHILLTKMLIDKKHRKSMYYAKWRMFTKYKCKSSRAYAICRGEILPVLSSAAKLMWQDPKYITKQAESAKTKYQKPGYSEMRSALSKKQMEDPEQLVIVKETFRKAHANIDHSSDEWLSRSIGSESAKQKHREWAQSDLGRQTARERELSKGAEYLSDRGKQLASIAIANGIAKFGSEDAYRTHNRNLRLGRKAYLLDGKKRMFVPGTQPIGAARIEPVRNKLTA